MTNEDYVNLRMSAGMNRKKFSEYLGIPYRTIQDWESGSRTPPDYIYKLIKAKLTLDNYHLEDTWEEFDK